MSYLALPEQDEWRSKLPAAYTQRLVRELQVLNASAAASFEEGWKETLNPPSPQRVSRTWRQFRVDESGRERHVAA